MNDWFIWNGVKCTDKGMHVLTPPPIVAAKERLEEIEIPGKSGTHTFKQGDNVYDDINLSASCIIDDMYREEDGKQIDVISEISRWLRGSGNVTFHNRPEGYYKARIANQISFEKVLRGNPHRIFSLEFRCKPFFRLFSGDEPVTITETSRLINLGNVESEPLLKVVGTGEGTIMCGSSTIIINDLDDIDYLMIDSEAKIIYTGEPGNAADPVRLMGSKVTGNWLTIPEDTSFLTIQGNISSVTITPRWRYV